jgi:hypothetical protein
MDCAGKDTSTYDATLIYSYAATGAVTHASFGGEYPLDTCYGLSGSVRNGSTSLAALPVGPGEYPVNYVVGLVTMYGYSKATISAYGKTKLLAALVSMSDVRAADITLTVGDGAWCTGDYPTRFCSGVSLSYVMVTADAATAGTAQKKILNSDAVFQSMLQADFPSAYFTSYAATITSEVGLYKLNQIDP